MSIDEKLYTNWEHFIVNNEVPEDVSPIIARSWERCRMRLSPLKSQPPTRLTSDHLLSAQVARFDLISIARPILEDIHQYIDGSSSAVILVNSAGYLLDMVSDPDIEGLATDAGIFPGTSLYESQAGTNAFSLALSERIPFQVRGPEHYLISFHKFADSAAPIFDLTGALLGALGVLTLVEQDHPHSLGLAVAGARAVEGQWQSEYLLAEQNSQLTSLNAVLTSIDEGILVWNEDGIVIHANSAAFNILGCPAEKLMGQLVNKLIHFPNSINQARKMGTPFSDLEAALNVEGRPVTCVISLRYVRSGDSTRATVATMRPTKQVRALIQRQIGTQPSVTLESLVGNHPKIQRVRRLAKSAAAAQASILIRGENGTGKISLAHAIHNYGPKRNSPFVIFSCASIPSQLLIPELIGYEEITNLDPRFGLDPRIELDPKTSRPSKFELADGGTIYFPDIDSLPRAAQTILKNVLDLGIVQRLGSKRAIEVDVRAIASTSSDIEKLISQNEFRADLFYCLHPFEISLPPLRDRKGDIPLIVNYHLQQLSQTHRRNLSISDDAMSLLIVYDWPGNLRELEISLRRATIQAGASSVIHAQHLPDHIRYAQYISLDHVPVDTLDDLERTAILDAAKSCKGNLSKMAKVLGIGRTTVWRRLKEYQIDPNQFRESSGRSR
jgi:transcriptional activator for dhaKLM operon